MERDSSLLVESGSGRNIQIQIELQFKYTFSTMLIEKKVEFYKVVKDQDPNDLNPDLKPCFELTGDPGST